MSRNAAVEAVRTDSQQDVKRVPLALQRRAVKVGLAVSDVAMVVLGCGIAFLLRFQLDLPFFREEIEGNSALYAALVAAGCPIWLLLFAIAGLYDEHNLFGGTREYAQVFNATSAGMLFLVVATFFDPEFVIARGWLLSAWALVFLGVAGGRFWIRRLVYRLRTQGWLLTPALVIGTNDEALSLAGQLVHVRGSGLDLRGFVTATPEPKRRVLRNLYTLGALTDLPYLVRRHRIEEIVVATSAVQRSQLVDVFRHFATRDDLRVRLSAGLFEVVTTAVRVKDVASTPLLEVQPVRLTGIDRLLKGALDYAVAGAGVIIAAPLLVLCALAVRLESRGPVLHRRRVLGLGGREFDAFKFRSMRIDGDALLDTHPELRRELEVHGKLEEDPRVTQVGRHLRRLSLDELPQLFNVLRGEMSVVGPRMISPPEHERYGRWDLNLLTVKPGITGLWQISGRSDLSYEDRVRLDMNYIRNWTIWLDLQLLLQTIPAVLRRRGAY